MRRVRTLTLGLALCALLLATLLYSGKTSRPAWAQPGGTPSETAADRQLVNVLRGEHTRASYRRCLDELSRYAWPDVRRIPADRVRAVRRTWEARLASVVATGRPRAECWRSHLWAEQPAALCVVDRESGGNLRSRSTPTGRYRGKWQMGAPFERAYGPGFTNRFGGRADTWPEWAQDVAAWRAYHGFRGYPPAGWDPWPNTSRACGLR